MVHVKALPFLKKMQKKERKRKFYSIPKRITAVITITLISELETPEKKILVLYENCKQAYKKNLMIY